MLRPLSPSPVAVDRQLLSPGRRNLLASLGSLALLSACGGGGGDPVPLPGTDVAGAARASVTAAKGLPGVAYGAVDADGVHLAAGGVRKLGSPGAITTADLFMIGSTTKATTAAVAGRLVERGLIGWDSTVVEALPDLADGIATAYRAVTLANLLDHRGGLPPYSSDAEYAAAAEVIANWPGPLPADETGRRAFLAAMLLAEAPPEGIVPGRDFLYSNAGYAIAAAMMEAATGETWQALFAEHITRALGVEGMWVRPELVNASQPVGHVGPRGGLVVFAPPSPADQAWLDVIAPAGLLTLTPGSYATWLDWHRRALLGQSVPLAAGYLARLRALAVGGYTMGWMDGRLPDGSRLLWHSGAWGGFNSLSLVLRDGSGAAFGMTNAFAPEDDPWTIAVMNEALIEISLRYRRA